MPWLLGLIADWAWSNGDCVCTAGVGPLAVAMSTFLGKFKEKTKNNWADRASFVKHRCAIDALAACGGCRSFVGHACC